MWRWVDRARSWVRYLRNPRRPSLSPEIMGTLPVPKSIANIKEIVAARKRELFAEVPLPGPFAGRSQPGFRRFRPAEIAAAAAPSGGLRRPARAGAVEFWQKKAGMVG